MGEQQVVTLAPQVRFRIPTWTDRLVPYGVVGLGGSWIQFNDRKSAGIGQQIDADGMTFSAVAGAGVDFFLADNIAFNVEGKYVWCDPIKTTVDGVERDWDASSFTASLGLRLYFDRNDPRSEVRRFGRFYFGTQGGFTVLTDGTWISGARIELKLNALGDTLNLNYTLALGSDFGEHLGLELALATRSTICPSMSTGPLASIPFIRQCPCCGCAYPLPVAGGFPTCSRAAGSAMAN